MGANDKGDDEAARMAVPIAGREAASPHLRCHQVRSAAAWATCTFGWLFDLFTVVVSLSDVVSDVVVAVQFYQAGQRHWFALVLASLVLASLAYTTFFLVGTAPGRMINLADRRFNTVQGWLVRVGVVLMVFAFSQFLPVINWFVTPKQPDETASDADAADAAGRDGPWRVKCHSAVGREAVSDAMASAQLMGRLQASLQHYMKAHGMFLIETVVEAIPQIVIQLLAVTFLGHATTAQVVSMSLSLLSIVSKAHVVAHSFDLRVFVFRLALPIFDLFSFFYLCATILEPGSGQDVVFPGTSHRVSYLTAVWMVKSAVMYSYALLAALAFFVMRVMSRVRRCADCTRSQSLEDVGWLLLGAIMLLPSLIVLESVKLSWLSVKLMLNHPHYQSSCALLFPFVVAGDRDERFYHMMWCYMRDVSRSPQRRLLESVSYGREDRYHNFFQQQLQRPPSEFRSRDVRYGMTQQGRRGRFLDRHKFSCPRTTDDCVLMFVGLGVILYAAGTVFNIVYPFVNAGLTWERQTPLQLMCLAPMLAALLTALFFTRRAWHYAEFCLDIKPLCREMSPEKALSWIEAYYHPPTECALSDCIPERILPIDVVGSFLSSWLTPGDVGVSSITASECRRIREQFAFVAKSASGHSRPPNAASDVVALRSPTMAPFTVV